MKIRDLKEMYKGEYCEVEVFKANESGEYYPDHFHTDNCETTDDYDDDTEIGIYSLMDEEEYNNTILVNGCVTADFGEWYGNKDAKVLCLLIK